MQPLLTALRAALFDFDGVIADTEPYQAKSYARLLEDHGVHFDADDFTRYVGNSEVQIYDMLQADYGIELDVADVHQVRASYLIEAIHAGQLKPYPFVAEVLDELDGLGCPSFIVSSNSPSTIKALLSDWSLRDRFVEIFTVFDSDDVNSKSELIEVTPDLIGCRPDELLLFEDSAAALETAHKIGLRTVGVRKSTDSRLDIAADIVLDPRH